MAGRGLDTSKGKDKTDNTANSSRNAVAHNILHTLLLEPCNHRLPVVQIETQIVLDAYHFLLSIREIDKHPGIGRIRTRTFATRNVPSVVMIENDLGLDLHNREAVLAALRSQGITDVAKFTLSGDI